MNDDGSLSTLSTDDELDKVFINVLITIRFHKESLDFVLQDQSVSIIHHLCLLEDCDLKSWATDGPLNTLEVRLITTLKLFVNNCKSKNGGTLPPSWHQGLCLEKLSNVVSGATTGSTSDFVHHGIITLLVWVKINCPSLQSTSMLKDYHQFSACLNYTYGQLLDTYLDNTVSLGLFL